MIFAAWIEIFYGKCESIDRKGLFIETWKNEIFKSKARNYVFEFWDFFNFSCVMNYEKIPSSEVSSQN